MNDASKQFAAQSLVAVLVLNGILLAAIHFLNADVPMNPAATYGAGAALSLVLWLAIVGIARQGFAKATTTTRPSRGQDRSPIEKRAPAPQAPAAAPAPSPAALAEVANSGAVQMLAILQRKGRLIDFLQEDIRAYADAQIGAAVRNVHEGCREALAEYIQLEAIYPEAEGSKVSVRDGFDARSVRLVGNVSGQPPFQGTLRHRGWRVARIRLPERVGNAADEAIVATAEVEVGS